MSRDITQPFFDESGEAIAELYVQQEDVIVHWGVQINDQDYRQALESTAQYTAAVNGYDVVTISSPIHATTTGGSHRGRGRGRGGLNRVSAPPHFTIQATSSYFPSSNTVLHVNIHVRTSNGHTAFETNAARRADPRYYPSGYPYHDVVATSTTMVSHRTSPIDAYSAMYLKWWNRQQKRAKRHARSKGDSGDWSDDGGETGAAVAAGW